jgi:hypothetical protein
MTHDPMHNVEGLSGALYDGSLGPCRLCEFAARVRADEREQAIRDAAGEAAIALLAMDGVEFTPEQHNSVVDAILDLQEKP